jgi:uncharacterized protein VirK/YbjX
MPITPTPAIHETFRIAQMVLAAAVAVHPWGSRRALWRQVRFLARAVYHRRTIATCMDEGDRGGLHQSLVERPHMLGAIEWPYIHKDWQPHERFAVVRDHYREVGDLPWLQLGVHEAKTIADLGATYPELRLVLDRPYASLREGELTLNLFIGDERIYSLAFTLGQRGGQRIAYVGGVQGRDLPDALELYKKLTKALQGARPRDFLISAFQMLAVTARVERVFGVGEAYRHHHHAYFAPDGKTPPRADYDQIWRDRGGRPTDDGFFELPAEPVARPMSEIPTQKRAMYRRRYALFEQVGAACKRFAAAIGTWMAAQLDGAVVELALLQDMLRLY